MARAFVSVGSNVDREHHVDRAIDALRERFGELQISSVYESEPVGFEGDPFFNLVVAFDTDVDAHRIVAVLREIEDACGRERNAERFSPRTMDLDLLMLDDLVMHDRGIVLPREEIDSQAFVLCPLAEIAGERRHPVNGETLSSMWSRFDASEAGLRKVRLAIRADAGI